MVQLVAGRGKRPILFNVPHVNERMFPPRIAREVHGKRDYHNPRLKAFCEEHNISLADICTCCTTSILAMSCTRVAVVQGLSPMRSFACCSRSN